ncbi:MAG TPA: hypothetical protein VFG22_13730 [Polyangiales bacterium]|jgi:hypothetical protein|nr:hypothetical protein [Polyangiales bacterium]
MNTEIRDPQFAISINEIANAIRWPDPSFALSPIEAAIDVLVAFYDAFARPDRVILEHALKGIAF